MHRYTLVSLFFLFTTTLVDSSYLFTQGVCRHDEVMCESSGVVIDDYPSRYNIFGRGCISESYVCDGGIDCFDNSDEKYCSYDFTGEPDTTTNTPATQKLSTTTKRPEVDSLQWSGRHEVPLFAMRVGMKMRQLDSRTYLQAERLINQVLFEAQMGNLTYFSDLLHCSKYLHSLNKIQHSHNLQLTTTLPAK